MTPYENPPTPPTWKLYEGTVSQAMTQWAEDVLSSYRTTRSPPMFGYETRDDFGDSVTYEAWVNWHPPDAQNPNEHSGVTLYVNTDPSVVEPNPLTFPSAPTLRVATATLGAKGADTDTKLTSASAGALKAAGLDFVVRYVSLGSPDAGGDLTPSEVQAILGAGLALMIVQHVRAPGWMPTAALGTQYGTAAAADAAACGYPAGATLWCDLEGVAAGASAANVTAYVNAWNAAATAKGYEPGLYVGSGDVLDANQLYATSSRRYWRSYSSVPNVSTRGYCLLQLFPTTTLAGVSVDLDVVQQDYKGGYPHWATA